MENYSHKNIVKEIVKLIITFSISYIILSVIFGAAIFFFPLYNIRINHPFAALYIERNAWLYIILSSLLLAVIYFLLGILNSRFLKIQYEKKGLILFCIICGFIQILSWIFMQTLAYPGNEGLLFAFLLNPPAFWSMNGLINIHDMNSLLTVLYYILPPVAFIFAIYINHKLFKKLK